MALPASAAAADAAVRRPPDDETAERPSAEPRASFFVEGKMGVAGCSLPPKRVSTSSRRYHWPLLFLLIATGCSQAESATLEANKAVLRRWAELEDQGNVQALADVATPDCVFHYPGGAEVRGIEALQENAAASVAAFSDMNRRIDHEVAEGDLVATQYTFTARHTGEYAGMPATGNDLSMTFMSLCRLADGKIAECWIEFDSQHMLQQLGGESGAAGSDG